MILIILQIQIYDLTRPVLPGSFICCNFIHYHFRKVFCNILTKLHSPDKMFSTVYVLILKKVLVLKILYLLVFAACYTHFPDLFLIARNTMGLDKTRYKVFTNAMKNLTYVVAYFFIKQFVFLLWFFFQRSFFVCSFADVMIHTCVRSH